MSHTAIQHILDEIERLSEEDRRRFETELENTQWRRDIQRLRAEALQRGIDEQVIDQAVHDHRYST